MSRRRAFTLIELLIVITIILILIGLLTPSVLMALRLSRQTQCANNLRSIGQGLIPFSVYNDGEYPDDYLWASQLAPYLRDPVGGQLQYVDFYLCPDDEIPANGSGPDLDGINRAYLVSYMMNGLFVDRGRTVVGRTGIQSLARIVLMCDGGNDNLWLKEQIDWDWDTNEDFDGGRIEVHHVTGNNFLFADGHVEFRQLDELPDADTQWSLEPLP